MKKTKSNFGHKIRILLDAFGYGASFAITKLLTQNILHKDKFLMDLAVFMVVFPLLKVLWENTAYLIERIRGGARKPNWESTKSNLIVSIIGVVFGTIYYFIG